MKRTGKKPHIFNSISELHRALALPKPKHPLVSVINFEEAKCFDDESLRSVSYNFYCIAIKKNFKGKMKYGQQYYDFDEGVMTFFSPMQVVTTDIVEGLKLSGYWLVVHPDFIRNYTLGKTIKNYGYFSYSVNEALHLSEDEDKAITTIMQNIENEYRSVIDHFSQDVIVSHIELLLNYCNRFYNRQFITRRTASNDLLVKLECLLTDYFNSEQIQESGLPTVQYVSSQLNISADYLSDMLRNLTGQNTQQHIHNHLIEKAKEKLSTTELSVSEIAYELGFEYPQSFSKLFKTKTNLTPLKFRQSIN
ncbi:Helix-turn-helix domain-containing protein [Pustulibacterium marinum]|uniref:Helix-turn-helix domain-containing protein n=1 Tax=Pustulibacterium marinum TaxID=1224947 RepID=A0A1I7IQP4_9FLAO|nr:helix-turn-helix transcriptional regulator [Pustulibacterium marinum]SFU75207.1 Helix-turn-helix domain-containing protein [Pustulibacterium marinum]